MNVAERAIAKVENRKRSAAERAQMSGERKDRYVPLFLTQSLNEKLSLIAGRLNLPKSYIIRQILDTYMERHFKKVR